jgi:dienelactone hydrolase
MVSLSPSLTKHIYLSTEYLIRYSIKTDDLPGYNLPEWSLSKFEAKPPPNLLGAAWHYLSYLLLAARLLPGLYLHNRPAAALPRIRDWLYRLRTERGASAKIGVAGFCWGGHFSIVLTHPDAGNYAGVEVPERSLPEGQAKGQMRSLAHVIDCSFTAHPALVEVPGHIEAAVQPLSVANGDDDEWMGRKDMQKLVETIEAKNRGVSEGEQKFEAVVYPGAPHGFAVRGNRDDPLQKERGDQSEDQAVRWFQKWFRSKG